jgi:membrane fusion protein (multidrug efflux system)
MDNKSYALILTASFAAALFGCRSQAPGQTPMAKMTPRVEGFIVRPADVEQTIQVAGTLRPFEETVLMPETAGRVVAINIQEGQFVKKGTQLVKLFDGDLQAALKKAVTQLSIADQTQKRQNELLKINGISQSDYDQALLQVNSISADIEILKVQIQKTELLAPFDGVIGLRNISLGAQVTPQTPLATIRMLDRLKLDFSVPEKYGNQIKPGMNVSFSIQGSDARYAAAVLATEQEIESSTRNLKIRATVTAKETSLIPGAFATVDLRLGENKNALMIPTQAIIPRERDKQVIVAKNGKARFITVKTGIRQNEAIEVVSGLSAGDTVVTTGLLFLKPGADIQFSKLTQ